MHKIQKGGQMNARISSRTWRVDLEIRDSLMSMQFGAEPEVRYGSGDGQQHTNMVKFSHKYRKFGTRSLLLSQIEPPW